MTDDGGQRHKYLGHKMYIVDCKLLENFPHLFGHARKFFGTGGGSGLIGVGFT